MSYESWITIRFEKFSSRYVPYLSTYILFKLLPVFDSGWMDILFADILQKAVDIEIFWLCVYKSLMLCHMHELCIAIRGYYEKDTTIKY